MPAPQIVRHVFSRLTRFFPKEHGKYSILTRIYFRWLAPSSTYVIQDDLHFGIRMNLDLSEYLQAHLFAFGSYELPTVRFLHRYLRSGDVAFDVGAQIGYLSLIMATAAQRGTTVYSFEPETTNASRLQKNVQLNAADNIHIERFALSDRDGTLKLYLSRDNNAGTHSTILIEQNVSSDYVEIPAMTLDSFVAANSISRLDLVKIDVEGGELEVVLGGKNTLDTLHPVLIMEVSDALQKSRNFSTMDLKKTLADSGYSAFNINDDGTLRTSPLDEFHLNDNVIFIHASTMPRAQHLITT